MDYLWIFALMFSWYQCTADNLGDNLIFWLLYTYFMHVLVLKTVNKLVEFHLTARATCSALYSYFSSVVKVLLKYLTNLDRSVSHAIVFISQLLR